MNWGDGSIRAVFVAKREICSTDVDMYREHRFFARYIDQWKRIVIGSSLATECRTIYLEYDGDLLSNATVDDPEDEKLPSVISESKQQRSSLLRLLTFQYLSHLIYRIYSSDGIWHGCIRKFKLFN